jgi:hypothetical protein
MTEEGELKPYCGAQEKIPKGKRRATPAECIACGQIRYYGLEKINLDKERRHAKIVKELEKEHAKLEKMEIKLAHMDIVMKKRYQLWKYETNEKKRATQGKYLKDLANKFVELRTKLEIADKKYKKNKSKYKDL